MFTKWWQLVLAVLVGALIGYLIMRQISPPLAPWITKEERQKIEWNKCMYDKAARGIPRTAAMEICLEEIDVPRKGE